MTFPQHFRYRNYAHAPGRHAFMSVSLEGHDRAGDSNKGETAATAAAAIVIDAKQAASTTKVVRPRAVSVEVLEGAKLLAGFSSVKVSQQDKDELLQGSSPVGARPSPVPSMLTVHENAQGQQQDHHHQQDLVEDTFHSQTMMTTWRAAVGGVGGERMRVSPILTPSSSSSMMESPYGDLDLKNCRSYESISPVPTGNGPEGQSSSFTPKTFKAHIDPTAVAATSYASATGTATISPFYHRHNHHHQQQISSDTVLITPSIGLQKHISTAPSIPSSSSLISTLRQGQRGTHGGGSGSFVGPTGPLPVPSYNLLPSSAAVAFPRAPPDLSRVMMVPKGQDHQTPNQTTSQLHVSTSPVMKNVPPKKRKLHPVQVDAASTTVVVKTKSYKKMKKKEEELKTTQGQTPVKIEPKKDTSRSQAASSASPPSSPSKKIDDGKASIGKGCSSTKKFSWKRYPCK